MIKPDWYQRDVSRETLDKLQKFSDLLTKWTAKINLIAKSTARNLDSRHIWDSAQVYRPITGRWVDIGSGGGLPGVVISVLAQGEGQELDVTLIESDVRKATFLRTCARELEVPITVLAGRAENTPPQAAEVVSARALSDLNQLLSLALPHLANGGSCVFMKGARWKEEIKASEKNWRFSYEAAQSNTNPEAAILTIKDIERV
jgi:16S rRNA (guanine527-N7)-methyltransferase